MARVTADDADIHDAPIWLPGEWTVDDLESTPDDGRRYELFDGRMVVSPIPINLHQLALRAIFRLLDGACPPDLEVWFAPFEFRPTRKRSYQPDALVTRRVDVDLETPMDKAPLLAVEVLSKGSRKLDLQVKAEAYATNGVDLYWTFDPRKRHFIARRRRGLAYVEMATASGGQRIRLDEPFPVEICPAELVRV
jgi:Uma2 family endonuclease